MLFKLRAALIVTVVRHHVAEASIYRSKSMASFMPSTAFGHRRKQTTSSQPDSKGMVESASIDNNNDEDRIPPLRYLGDEQLMQKQPMVTLEELESEAFQAKLDMLPLAMKKYGGIGIAAPQIGLWTRVFCFGIDGSNPRYPEAQSLPLTVWINPKITWASDDTTCWMWEGCLSVPGMRGWVERPSEVILSGLDETGMEREPQHLTGLAARIAQHELDHLDGILFPQCVPDQNFLVPAASVEARDGWATDWPSPGSHRTALGGLCEEK